MKQGAVLWSRYVVRKVLGKGGMGTTFLATDRLTDDSVALKLVSVGASELSELLREEFVVLKGLTHPRLLRVRDFGRAHIDGEAWCYYVADYVEGSTLDEAASGETFSEIRRALADVVEAISFLHSMEILHGDVKPSNIIVDAKGRATLIDLGCARPFGTQAAPSGTHGFVPKEVLEGAAADPRVDVFAFGSTMERLIPCLSSPPPKSVIRLVERLIAEKVEDRPSDMDEVLESLGIEGDVVSTQRGLTGRLVGRDGERALFSRLLTSLLNGKEDLRGLFLEGADGIGRSRLLAEMKWESQIATNVVEGSFHEHAPIESMLHRALGEGSELASGLGPLLRMKDALAEGREPTVLIFDDVHRLPEKEVTLLDALLRSLRRSDALLVVAAGRRAGLRDAPAIEVRSLSPLTPGEVELWVGDVVPGASLDDLLRFTGGFPAHVEAVLARRAAYELTSADLALFADHVDDESWAADLHDRLTEAELEVLGLLALHGGGLDPDDVAELGGSSECASHLNQRGWARWEEGEYRLARRAEAGSIASALGEERRRQLQERLAEWLHRRVEDADSDEEGASRLRAQLVGHLAKMGRIADAEELFLEGQSRHELWPELWRDTASTLASMTEKAEIHVAAADIETSLGHPQRALVSLEKLFGRGLDPAEMAEVGGKIAACYIALGRGADALKALDTIPEGGGDARALASRADLRARAFIKSGEYGRAREIAESALANANGDGEILAALRLDAGLAASYLGSIDGARRHLEVAEKLYEKADDIQGRIRSQSYRALTEYRSGNLSGASKGYREALDGAERYGLSDQIALASLNLGTVCHQMGDLGGARTAYDRGLRIASALGMVSTEVTLLFDLAMLYLDVGLFDRALTATKGAEAKAKAAGIERVFALGLSLKGEIALAQGDGGVALSWFTKAHELLEPDNALRELAEIDLHLVEATLINGEVSEASDLLRRATAGLEELEADDLVARAAMLRARVLVELDDLQAAVEEVELGISLARRIGKRLLEAELLLCAAGIFESEGASFAASRHRGRARELLERMATTLPRTWRDAFLRHPRYSLPLEPNAERGAEGDASHEAKLRHLLEINKRLNSSLDAVEVLRVTMDAAIELTGAERGFVILAQSGDGDGAMGDEALEVPVARNLDREKLNRSHLKYSQSIARSVIDSGEPVITVDAESDTRFEDNVSIHAMRLKSVMCVPIRSREKTIGALYLDNRFQRGRFAHQETGLLLAFADQAALAIDNARLHGELERRTRDLMHRTQELEAERERVEELLADQAGTIERLSEELRINAQQRSLRHDYSTIVGSSPTMQSVFEKLDRVIDTPLTVLIQGESGTGKELCARAVHTNGPRSGGPFVSLNCGAVPESLLEAELFGHVKGAFTGAVADRGGVFQAARGGTLFLDEVGEMPSTMQVKLLRVIQESEVVPVGSVTPIDVDARLVCATNRLLSEEVRAGRFRSDLYYRLAVVEITLPPLRDRIEDVRQLSEHFLAQIAERLGRSPPTLRGSAWRALGAYPWPGNVRQLENVLTQVVVFSESDSIGAQDLQFPAATLPIHVDEPIDRQSFEQHEAEEILAMLRAQGWNVRKTAEVLSVPRSTLYHKMKRYGIHRSSRVKGRKRS